MTDLQEMLRNTIEGYERERLEAAEREHYAVRDLKQEVEMTEAKRSEEKADFLSIIRECVEALNVLIVFSPKGQETHLRTILARATDRLAR